MRKQTNRDMLALCIPGSCVTVAAVVCSAVSHSWIPVAGVTFGFFISVAVAGLTIGACKLSEKIWSDDDE